MSPIHTYFVDAPELLHLREGSFYIGVREDGAGVGAIDHEVFWGDGPHLRMWVKPTTVSKILGDTIADLPFTNLG